jgi:hypothetical protein
VILFPEALRVASGALDGRFVREAWLAHACAWERDRPSGSRPSPTVTDKHSALLADRAAKLEALFARFVLRIELMPIALRVIEVESGFASVTLRRRKASRTLELEYDAVLRRIVAPRCDGCGGAAPRPAACDDALHLLCEACAPRAEGRVACVSCKPRAREQAAREGRPPG